MDRAILEAAATMPGADFEDNIQLASAVTAGVDAIVTREMRLVLHQVQSRFSPRRNS